MENILPKLFTRREMLYLVISTYNVSHTCSVVSLKYDNYCTVKLAESLFQHSGMAFSKRSKNLLL